MRHGGGEIVAARVRGAQRDDMRRGERIARERRIDHVGAAHQTREGVVAARVTDRGTHIDTIQGNDHPGRNAAAHGAGDAIGDRGAGGCRKVDVRQRGRGNRLCPAHRGEHIPRGGGFHGVASRRHGRKAEIAAGVHGAGIRRGPRQCDPGTRGARYHPRDAVLGCCGYGGRGARGRHWGGGRAEGARGVVADAAEAAAAAGGQGEPGSP